MLDKCCKQCKTALIIGINFTESLNKSRRYYCKSCSNAYSKEWKKNNPDTGKRYAEKVKDLVSKRNRKVLLETKQIAMSKCGGVRCCACGINDIRVLQINHKNGGGSKEGKHGLPMYKAIVKGTRSTEDLEVRCANCNLLYEYDRGTRQQPEEVTIKYEPFTFL